MLSIPRIACAVVLSVVVVSGGTRLRAGEAAPDHTPLQSRAKVLLESYSKAKTRDEQASSRNHLLAMADTLESAGEDEWASQCLERAGIVCYRFAEYEQAVEIWGKGIRVARRSGNKKRIAALLNAQASGVSMTGDDEGAIELQGELLTLRRELGDVRGEGISMIGIGVSWLRLFRYPEAVEAYQTALRLLRRSGKTYDIAHGCASLSSALFAVGETEAALAMADTAVALARTLGNLNLLGHALEVRAVQRHDSGWFEDALADYEESHQLLKTAGMTKVQAINDLHWANALVQLGQCEAATELIDDALRAVDAVAAPQWQAWGWSIRARALGRCGDPEEARLATLGAIERFEALRETVLDEVARADAFRMASSAYTDLAILAAEAQNPHEAWLRIEQGTAHVLREQLGIGSPTSETLVTLRRWLAEIDAVALHYSVAAGNRAVVCVVSPDTVLATAFAVEPDLRTNLSAAMRLMSSGASDAQCRAALDRIGTAVLDPIAAAFQNEVARLIVVPGLLSGFPIETLPLPGGRGVTVGDRYAVTYAPSAASLLHFQNRTAPSSNLVVFADPTIAEPAEPAPVVAMRSAKLAMVPLPEARAEGAAIAGSDQNLFTGDAASKTAFLNHATRAGVLHLASHAMIDGSNPDHSGVLLAASVDGDVLSAAEIQSVAIHADLVSLSGCRTAGGYMALGEGAFGLTRAFLVAGSRSVVSSWWDVEDRAARRFMELYYKALRAGVPRDLALQQARRTMADEQFVLRDRGAFALTGATGTPVLAVLAPPSRSSLSWILVGLVLIVALSWALAHRVAKRGPHSRSARAT